MGVGYCFICIMGNARSLSVDKAILFPHLLMFYKSRYMGTTGVTNKIR